MPTAHPDTYPVLALAKRGNPQAIANLMNARLQSLHIHAKVGWKDQWLGILLESAEVPPQQAMVRFVQRGIETLKLTDLKGIRIYGRMNHQTTPAWREVIECQVSRDLTGDKISLLEWLSQGSGSGETTATSVISNTPADATTVQPTSDQKLLRFYFSPEETALLPLTCVKEVLKIPLNGILPVPDMPESVLGLYNCRGEMLWLMDLGARLGFPSVLTTTPLPTKVSAIVLQREGTRSIAVIVPQVNTIESHPLDALQPPSADLFSPQLLPFLQGYLRRSSSPVLNVSTLIHSSAIA